jgi:hypothetical protein
MSRNEKPKGKAKPPTFVRQVPKFLKQYSHMLTTNKKNYLGDVEHQQEEFDSVEAVEKEGAEIVNIDKHRRKFEDASDSEGDVTVVEHSSAGTAENTKTTESEEEKAPVETVEYFKDGKIVFNSKADRSKRPITTDHDEEQTLKKTKKQKKGAKSLLSFETDDDI